TQVTRRTSTLFVVNGDGTGRIELSPSGADGIMNDSDQQWTVDGNRLLTIRSSFQGIAMPTEVSGTVERFHGLVLVEADGSGRRVVAGGPEFVPASFALSPDGSRIAVVSRVRSADETLPAELYVMDIDGSDASRLEIPDATTIMPAWSPDGRWLALTEQETNDSFSLYRISADGSDLRQISGPHTGWADRPVWTAASAPPVVELPPLSGDDIELLDYQNAILQVFAPVPVDQERQIVVNVEALGEHDSAIDAWTADIWQRWSADGAKDEGVYITARGEIVTHIALDGQQRLLTWSPDDALAYLDVPFEYSLQSRLLGAVLSAALDPEAHELRAERDGEHVVLHLQWIDHYAEEFGYTNVAQVTFDAESRELQLIVHLIDRPDVEPYPVRIYDLQQASPHPAGSSPAGTYESHGEWPSVNGTPVGRGPDPAATPLRGMDAVEATWTAQAESEAAMWQQLRSRPFVAPPLAPDGSCGQSEEFRLGQEPIYVQGEISHAETNRSYSARAGSNNFARYKVVWYASPAYDGSALVRGQQLDGNHTVRFDFETSIDREADELKLISTYLTPNGDWRTWHGAIVVPAPGCYAMQVDGLDFSYTIVIEVPE
ncbi:MAG TPA: hypothetical protein VMM78_17520, partial [Thermomicrobiales bacterium]|nr:hypothetical protein [Thermomicrobiales bacterium]